MKSYTQYLTENKKSWKFKVKTIHELTDEQCDRIEKHLGKYDSKGLGAARKTILQSAPRDFPQHRGYEVFTYDFETNLIASGWELANGIRNMLGLADGVVDDAAEGMAEDHPLVLLHARSVVDGRCRAGLEGLVVGQSVLRDDLPGRRDGVLFHQPHGSHLRPRYEGHDLGRERQCEPVLHVGDYLLAENVGSVAGRLVVPSLQVLDYAGQSVGIVDRVESPVRSSL